MWGIAGQVIVHLISAIAAYIRYRYDPEVVKRRDQAHERIKRITATHRVDELLSERKTLPLSFFASEQLRMLREYTANPGTREQADSLFRSLPKRGSEDRRADDNEGF